MVREIKILGINFVKINAKKDPNYHEKITMKPNIDLISIEKEKIELIKQEALRISFNFEVNYEKLGNISLEGVLLLSVDAKTLKEAITQWKDKKLPEDLKLLILNIILQKSSLRALKIEEEMGLPFHMQMPRLDYKPKESK